MSKITSGTFDGPAGPLEYILSVPEGAAATRAGLICHPHPLHGGTMNTRIVFHTSAALVGLGLPVLRFNFRGVGRSGGTYDHGRGEQEDVAAGLAFLRSRFAVPVVLGGFSFGSTVVAKLLARTAPAEVERVLLLGLPADRGPIPADWSWRGPKLMISGDQDEFASVAALEAYFARLAEPKARQWVAGGDHFLTGKMEEYRAVLSQNLDFDGRGPQRGDAARPAFERRG